jgi:hypothetical protein
MNTAVGAKQAAEKSRIRDEIEKEHPSGAKAQSFYGSNRHD